MEMYTALIEVDHRAMLGGDVDRVDKVMDRLNGYHAALGGSSRGWATARVSLPAESLQQATVSAAAVVAWAFDARAIACEVTTEVEFLAREGWVPVPDLVSVSEAAALLGVSRQAVLQRINSGSLPASRVGREYAIPRSAVVASAERAGQDPFGLTYSLNLDARHSRS